VKRSLKKLFTILETFRFALGVKSKAEAGYFLQAFWANSAENQINLCFGSK